MQTRSQFKKTVKFLSFCFAGVFVLFMVLAMVNVRLFVQQTVITPQGPQQTQIEPGITFDNVLLKSREVTYPVKRMEKRVAKTTARVLAPVLPPETTEKILQIEWINIFVRNSVVCLVLSYGILLLAWGATALFITLADQRTGRYRHKYKPSHRPKNLAHKLAPGYTLVFLVQTSMLALFPILAVLGFGAITGFVTGLLRDTDNKAADLLFNFMLIFPQGVPESIALLCSASLPVTLFVKLKKQGFSLLSAKAGHRFVFCFLKSRLVLKTVLASLLLMLCGAVIEDYVTWELANRINTAVKGKNITHIHYKHVGFGPTHAKQTGTR